MVQILSRKVSFGELSFGAKVAYALFIVFGLLFTALGILDIFEFEYLRPIQLPRNEGSFLLMPRWLSGLIFIAAGLICLYVMPSVIKEGSADRPPRKNPGACKEGEGNHIPAAKYQTLTLAEFKKEEEIL